MIPWDKVLERPHPGGHFVQLYQADESALTANVCNYIWTGLSKGDGVLLVVTPRNRELFSAELTRSGADLEKLIAAKQLVILDAAETLALFMVDGQPNWSRFQKAIRGAMARVRPTAESEGLRAFGEMVGLLWESRQFRAAIRLEQLWNKLLEQAEFSLFCAYCIDIFEHDVEVSNLNNVFCAHTHVLPSQPNGMLDAALNRSFEEAFGDKADAMRVLINANQRRLGAVLPEAEGTAFWLRKNMPGLATMILGRARKYYQQLLRQDGSSALHSA